jgi:hypothetical protein
MQIEKLVDREKSSAAKITFTFPGRVEIVQVLKK